jgi:hypothetical protein
VLEAVAAVIPASEYPASATNLRRMPRAKYGIASAKGGQDRILFSYEASTSNYLGVASRPERGYQQTYAEATSTTALIADTPTMQLRIAGVGGAMPTFSYLITVEYDIECFEVQIPGV